VNLFVKRQKNDVADAEVICEAAGHAPGTGQDRRAAGERRL
jgi:hypothetical protein